MKSLRHSLILLIVLLLLPLLPAAAATPEPPARPAEYVVDLARIINDGTEAALNRYLRELEQKTTAQVVVLTIQSLDGEDIAGFSLRTAEKWKLGQKGKDNGLLITVSVNDRKYRLETGYGLEGTLPDSFVGTVGRQYFVPYFRKGDYGTGIFQGTLAVIQRIAVSQGVQITGMPAPQMIRRPKKREIGLLDAVAGIFLLGGALYLLIRHPRLLLLFLLNSSMGRRGGGWSSGSGGFGGGGGGSFGGGGSSGSW
ncbi:MAG: TPM domain-containing protein [Thermodesulfovibrionales bacterium]|jgi:uncharacterized protein